MLTIRDLSKEVDMTAVRGGDGLRRPTCGGENDSRERFDSDDRHHGERGERNNDDSLGFGCFTKLPPCGLYDATK